MRTFLYFILVIIPFSFISQKQINVVFFVNDSKTSSTELYSFSNMVFLNNKEVKINNFNIYHFTSNKERDTIWANNKKQVYYRVFQTDCEFSICASLNTLIPDKKHKKTNSTIVRIY